MELISCDSNSFHTCLNNLMAYVRFWISALYTSKISPSPIRKSLWKFLVPSMMFWKLMEDLNNIPEEGKEGEDKLLFLFLWINATMIKNQDFHIRNTSEPGRKPAGQGPGTQTEAHHGAQAPTTAQSKWLLRYLNNSTAILSPFQKGQPKSLIGETFPRFDFFVIRSMGCFWLTMNLKQLKKKNYRSGNFVMTKWYSPSMTDRNIFHEANPLYS